MDDDFFKLLNQNILEEDTARKQPTEEENLNVETVGFVNDETMFDAEVIGHIEELQRLTADPLPFTAGHWQGDVAQDCHDDGDYNQTFEVNEEHSTSATPEKKHLKSNEVESPDVIHLLHFLTYPPPPRRKLTT